MALSDNIVAYWKLDESSGNAADSVGSSTLTNNNSITYSSGKINNGANLASASSQYFSVADNAALSITGDMTIAGWFKFTTTGTDQTLVAKRTSTGNQRSWSLSNPAGTSLQFSVSSDGATVTNKMVSWSPSTGTWYHIAAVYTASAGSVSFYVNGSQQGTTQTGLPTSIFDSTSPFSIGCIFSPAQDFLNGSVDEVGLWSRALSSTDISALYASGNGNQYPFSSSVTLAVSTMSMVATFTAISFIRIVRLLVSTMSLTSTFNNIFLRASRTLSVSTMAIVSMFNDIVFRVTGWSNETKHEATFTNQTKNSAAFTNQTKNPSSWSNSTKH